MLTEGSDKSAQEGLPYQCPDVELSFPRARLRIATDGKLFRVEARRLLLGWRPIDQEPTTLDHARHILELYVREPRPGGPARRWLPMGRDRMNVYEQRQLEKKRMQLYREAAARKAGVPVDPHGSVQPVADGAFVTVQIWVPLSDIEAGGQ